MSVRFYRIYGIKGGPKIGSLDPMGGPEDEGLIVSFAPWGDIIYSDEYPVELVVDGYPERRYPEEPDSVVTIALSLPRQDCSRRWEGVRGTSLTAQPGRSGRHYRPLPWSSVRRQGGTLDDD